MPKKNILFIDGVPDNHRLKVRQIRENGTMSWLGSGSANLSNYLQNDLFDRSKLIFDTRDNQKIPRKTIHAVFNQISDADSHKIALKKADNFYKHVSGNVPFFNLPSNVMKTTRDNIYQSLQGIDKLHVPKTVKIQPESLFDIYDVIEKEHFEFPVIFRQAGDHGGISTILIKDKTESFYAFALDGRDYYLTQFVDYKEDGLYRKHRLIVVDGEVYLRHVKFSDQWIVHHKTLISNPEELQKAASERFLVEIKPAIRPIIREIYNRLKLDYFGIDCYIDKDMNILVFEINANMGIFFQAKDDIFKDHLEIIRQELIKMIVEKKLPND